MTYQKFLLAVTAASMTTWFMAPVLANDLASALSQGPLHHRELLQPVQMMKKTNGFEQDVAGRDLANACDVCGAGSCGRTTPLGDFFEATVEASNPSSTWIVSCLYPNRDAPNCYYSPGGETVIQTIAPGSDFKSTVAGCQGECCTWRYPRYMWDALPYTDTRCNGNSTCMEMSQVCNLQSNTKTFSCPVGTVMRIEGGSGSTTLTVGAGAQLVSAVGSCRQVSNGLVCPSYGLQSGYPVSAIVAADDCNCILCDEFNRVLEGDCASSILSSIPSEGVCAPTTSSSIACAVPDDGNREGDGTTTTGGGTTVTQTGTGSTGGGTVATTGGEKGQIVAYYTRAANALDSLQSGLSTLSLDAKKDLVSTFAINWEDLNIAIMTATDYKPEDASYLLSLVAGVKSQFELIRCGVVSACIDGSALVRLFVTTKSLLSQIKGIFDEE